jgi:hypothetical protein
VAQLLGEWRLRAYVEVSIEGIAARVRDLERRLQQVHAQQ